MYAIFGINFLLTHNSVDRYLIGNTAATYAQVSNIIFGASFGGDVEYKLNDYLALRLDVIGTWLFPPLKENRLVIHEVIGPPKNLGSYEDPVVRMSESFLELKL